MKTREELQEENNDLRAAMRAIFARDSNKSTSAREVITRIREEAGRSVVPDYRAGMLLAAGMLEGSL